MGRKIPNIYILDEHENPVGTLNPSLPNGCPFFEDIHTERLEDALLTFEFEVPANHPLVEKLVVEGYIVYPKIDNPGAMDLFKVKDIVDSHSGGELRKRVFCENAAVSDLLGNIVRPATLNSYTLEQAVEYILQGTDWFLLDAEYSGVRDIEIDDYMTSLEALHKVLEAFDTELEFLVEFDGLRVVRKGIRALQQRGENTRKVFTYGVDLVEVERKEDSTDLVTALIGVGKQDSQGNYLTFANYNPSDLDTSKYEKGTDWVGNKEAFQRWAKKGKHIFGIYKDEQAQNPVELFNNTLKKLDELSKPRITYVVKVALLERLLGLEAHKVKLGDTVIVKDTTFQPELVVEARIIEKKTSLTSPENDEVTLGEFRPIVFNSLQRINQIQDKINKKEALWDNARYAGTSFHVLAEAPKPLVDGNFRDYDHHMEIKVTENIHIGFVSIFCEQADTTGVVELRDSQNNVLESRELYLPNVGENRVNLDFLLSKEVGSYRLYANFDKPTFRTTQGLSYPYDSGSFKVTGSSSSEGYWYFFYDIEISGVGVKGAYGRELKLGDANNRLGTMVLLNPEGESAVTIGSDSIGVDRLIAGEVVAPNVVTIGEEDATYYVNGTTGNDENDGLTPETAFSSITKVISMLPRVLDSTITINIQSDLVESPTISGFMGRGNINIQFNNHKLTGTFLIDSCKVRVQVTDGEFLKRDGETTAVTQIFKSDYVSFTNCKFQGKRDTTTPSNATSATVAVYDNSFAYFANCELWGANRENIRASYGARAMVYNCFGGDSSFGVYAEYGGVVAVRGYVPNVGSPTGQNFGGEIRSESPVVGQEGTAPAPVTPPKTSTWNSSEGDSWRTRYNSWRNDGTVRQGEYSGYGLHSGCWFFGSAPSTAVTGKNITKIRVYLRRLSQGGSASSQRVYIRWHSYTGQPTGQPTLSSSYVTAYFKWGEQKWVDLHVNSDFVNAFKNGTAKGIGIYTSSASPYMIFDDSAKLEITYS